MTCPDPPVLQFDDITLDLKERRLLRAGELQLLDARAFAVLCLLARSPGQVFSPEEILDEVWGHHRVPPGAVGQIVGVLRAALGDDVHQPRYLHAVRGYGYRFDRPEAREPGGSGHP